MYCRNIDHGFSFEPRRAILWRLLDDSRSEQQCPGDDVIPGEQHPRAVEARVLLRDSRWYGWRRRYCWRINLQVCQTRHASPDEMLIVCRFQDKPGYRPGLYACIACCLLTLIIVGLITLGSWRSNKKADRGEVELEYFDVSSLSAMLSHKH